MAKISKKEFLKDVKHEIDMLKKYGTKEELDRLNFSTFNPNMVIDCIYGQMTGSCMSSRAKELMDKSCIRTMNLVYGSCSVVNKTFRQVSTKGGINGDYDGKTWGTQPRTFRRHSDLSPGDSTDHRDDHCQRFYHRQPGTCSSQHCRQGSGRTGKDGYQCAIR